MTRPSFVSLLLRFVVIVNCRVVMWCGCISRHSIFVYIRQLNFFCGIHTCVRVVLIYSVYVRENSLVHAPPVKCDLKYVFKLLVCVVCVDFCFIFNEAQVVLILKVSLTERIYLGVI